MQYSEAIITGQRRPLGYQQILSATLATAQGLTLPTLPAGMLVGYALIQSNGGVTRWRDDGTSPSASVGMVLNDGDELTYTGDFTKIKFILSSSTPILDIAYYGP
jgi:hypothetical protein